MSSGARIGLQTLEEAAEDTQRILRERDAELRRMDPSLSGRDAQTVYRDASGRRVNVETLEAERLAKQRAEEEKKLAQLEANKGEVQKREAEERRARMMEFKDVPLAIYKEDKVLNEKLKEEERWADPMLPYLMKKKNKKKKKKSKKDGDRDDEDVPAKPAYKGPIGPPNRFDIAPGHRWDGVDRSNGFEREYFARMAENKWKEAEAYKWSVEDM
ncbi:uncharacterized protein VTP21DRAFT_2072 [Calcarisporiella thermophila]|uniref:uncharacterized protein n=1 Tax=Calcarisporiella thermophila TaxID=911321 RepID=UPI003743120A